MTKPLLFRRVFLAILCGSIVGYFGDTMSMAMGFLLVALGGAPVKAEVEAEPLEGRMAAIGWDVVHQTPKVRVYTYKGKGTVSFPPIESQ